MNGCQIQGCQYIFLKKNVQIHQKKTDLNRKSQEDTKLDQTFYYLPYMGICKLQNVLVNNEYTVTLLMNFCVCRNYYIAVTWKCLHF